MKVLKEYVESKGGEITLNTAAQRLIYEGGKIVGVAAMRRNKPVTYKANKGVLLAAGGYARNVEMLGQYTPTMRHAKSICGLGSTGDGIKMALAYGANLLDTPYVKATYGFSMNASTIKDTAYAYYSGAIIVNQSGKRIVNESLSYKLLGDVVLGQKGAYAFQIYDEPIRQAALKRSVGAGSPAVVEEKGAVLKADSIRELASLAGIDAQALEKTISDYNSYVESGVDPEFGRQHLSSNFGDLLKIETGPFYCFQSTAVLLATYCGIRSLLIVRY